jgi:hypothetical protein
MRIKPNQNLRWFLRQRSNAEEPWSTLTFIKEPDELWAS